MAGWIKMKRGTEVGLGLRQIVLNGDPAPLPKGHSPPPIFGYACCGQTAGLIKMQLGTELGLGPDHTVLDGDPASSPQRVQPRIFGPCLLLPNGRPS